MAGRYDLRGSRFDGQFLLKDFDIPRELRNDLRERGYRDLVSLLAAMIGSPEAFRPYYAKFGVDYDQVQKLLTDSIPAELREQFAAGSTQQYTTGLTGSRDRRHATRPRVFRRQDWSD